MDQFIQDLSRLDPLWIYLVVVGIAYIENILPPFPSDVIVVAAGSLAGIGVVGFLPLLLLATVGSTLGFMSMYKIGNWFGHRILETGRMKFIPLESVQKVEQWFRIYGYWIIIANRFLAGTRAVVSFFAGLSELSLIKSTVLSFLSALAWNSLLLFAGKKLGENWRSIIYYLEAYSKLVTVLIIVGVLLYLAVVFYKKRTPSSTSDTEKT